MIRESSVFMVILTTALVSSGKEEPYFVRSPTNVDVVLGHPVTLPCEVTPNNGMMYYWELNGSKITNTTRRFQKGSDLHITRVDRERDAGQFTCIAEDGKSRNGAITSSPATLNIQFIEEPIVQLAEPQDASTIRRATDVILRCHLDASGDVHIEWFRNADRLSKSTRLDIKKKRLHIKAAEPSDNGVYRCSAKNEAGMEYSNKNYALIVPGENVPLIQTVPTNQIAKKGGTAYFDCAYQHADVLEWYFKDSGPLESNTHLMVHSNGTLQINNVGTEDQGMYNCVGIKSESAEVPQSYSAELKLGYLEPFSATSFEPPISKDSKIIALGSLFQLTCLEPKSLPRAKKWWENPNGHTISDTGEIRVDDGRLIIENVKMENAGKYTCKAESIAGKTEKAVEVIITTKPEIISQPTSITVDEDEKSVLTCKYTSNSPDYTTVRWRKDGKIFKHDIDESNMSHHRIRTHKHNGTLVIDSTQTSDRGEYVCEIITEGFEPVVSKPATISVIEQLRFAPAPVNKKMELGSVTKIHCKAQGTPPPIIKWDKEGSTSESFASHITDMNGTLHFNGVQAEDKGKYNCIASNSQGIINASIIIEVVVAPKFSVLPRNPTESVEGQSVMIDCVVEGDPKPTIQWDKDLKMNDFDLSRFTVLPNGTLYISEVHKDDENKYGCTAGSSAGLNRKEVQLIVYSRDSYHPEQDGDTTVTKAVLITMSVAGAYIVLVIGLMVWCRYRRRSRKLPIGDGKAENGDIEHTELKDGANGTAPAGPSKVTLNGIDSHKEGQKSDGAETCNSQTSNQSKKSKSSGYDKLALSRSHLKELKLIGRGEFGDVMVSKISQSVLTSDDKRNSAATTPKSEEKSDELPVLVKVLTQTKEESCLAEFKREIDMFNKLSHENVTKLYGLCREVEPHYLILEHTDWGDLKKFLLATKAGSPPPLTQIQCIAVTHQLSRGMDYLANNRMVHKDLAARNCLVTSTLVPKIGLPRLTKDPYSQEYCKHMNQIIPLRWLPYEAVYEDEYSTKSDVYSFGVLIWEIFAQGELPHSKINDNSFLNKLKEKKLEWKVHASTPEALHKLQESCWDLNPQNRPSFLQISKEVSEILKSM